MIQNNLQPLSSLQEDVQDFDALCLAKSYFDLKEYDRAAYFLRGCCSQKAYFLYMYSCYLVGGTLLQTPSPAHLPSNRAACLPLSCFMTPHPKSGEKKKDDETVDSLGESVAFGAALLLVGDWLT